MKKIFFALLIFITTASIAAASNIEGTNTYKDYLFILVHGINGGSHHFNGQDGRDKQLRLQQYLENDLGLKGRVYAYSFGNKNGSSVVNAREFGDRTYKNTATYINSNGDKNVPMDGKCWLEKAREDFIKWFKDPYQNPKNPTGRDPLPDEIPSKYIVVAHSMGNMAVRLYVYSPYMKDLWRECYPGDSTIQNGFYRDDIAKVVFIAPPFTGSDMAYAAVTPKVVFQSWLVYDKLINGESVMNKLIMNIFSGNYNFLSDPYAPYKVAKEASFVMIDYPMFIDNLYGFFGVNPDWVSARQMDPIEGGGYGILNAGTWQLMPEVWFEAFNPLLSARYNDPDKEPAYSVIYGLGGPVLNFNDVLRNKLLGMYAGSKADLFDSVVSSSNYAQNLSMSNSDMTSQFSLNEVFANLGPEIELMMPGSGFYNLSTAQAKFVSLVMSNKFVGFSEDGDSAVPVHSAKGMYEEKVTGRHHATKHLENAQFYPKTYKGRFNDFLEKEFPNYLIGAGIAYAGLRWGGLPHETALQIVQWPLAILVVGKVIENKDDIWFNHYSHTNSLLKEYDIIKTAVLDTPAIFSMNDLQRIASGEIASSVEGSVHAFTAGVSVPSGFESLKVKSISEKRNATGTISLPVPMTLNGERKYVAQMTLTKAPQRIAGKLNYLIPRLMRSFEYSFNFSAWKPIENVDPETGEFVLEGLPFAEGQNVIAIRAENAVGVKSHQLLKIVLNTIPLLPSQFNPMPNYYISNATPNISVEFNKSEYTGDYESEKITIKSMEIDSISVEPQVESRMESYHPWAKASYKIPTDKPLEEGEHRVVVKAESNVGVAQGIWSFYVDRSPPAISMEALPPYSARSPTTIKFNVSDEVSPNLLSVRCELYDSNDNLVTTIATADALSKGENFFSWNPVETPIPADGNYKIMVKALDLAGNQAVAEQPITIDSTPPIVAGIDVSPNPMTSKTTELGLTARVNEKSTVIIKLNNTTNNSTTAFLTQANKDTAYSLVPTAYLASYTWKYDNIFSKGPEDGIYRVEVIARDEAGNESAPRTLEAFRIDLTPPNIFGQITNPYVLSNIGSNAYKTTLFYNLSSEPPSPSGRGAGGEGISSVRIKIYNSSTGTLVDTIPAAPAANGANEINWDGSSSSFPKGAYKFQIVAEDDVGNVGTAYASCVKDGIAPVISFPAEDDAEVAGAIAIRGTAIDPDWTNDKPFKRYSVFYKKTGEDWKTDFVEVPLVNRDPRDPKNISIRPLQNNSTLAYLYTNNLENGEYTIKVVVDEEGGESLAATRTIKVNNDALAASSVQLPYIKLKSLPTAVEFKSDDSVKLPLGFINSVKPANVYLEVVRPSPSGEGSAVFFKYFPNILGAPFIGKPDYKAGTDLGYFIWSDDDGYHVRWSSDGRTHKFTGNIIAIGGNFDSNRTVGEGAGVRASSNLLSWDSSISGGESGIDFKISSGQLMITAKIDEDPSAPSIYAENVYLGVSKFSQQYLPIMIDVSGQRLVDISSMGKAVESSNLERSTQTIEWDGKFDTGAFVDNGTYIVRVRAEGADGVGVATDEAMVEIKTPFELTNLKVDPADRNFSTLGGIDRITVSYNISKDSLVSAYVYDKNDTSGKTLAKLVEGEEILGTTNPNNPLSIVWKGNYPDPESGLVVTGGAYKIKLIVAAKDGSGNETKEIDNISITKFDRNASAANLEPIGEEVNFNNGYGWESIRLAAGDSPYYFEARGTGKYHPPKDFSYTLTATGKQKITAYPYVPFAMLVHRGFNGVNIKVKTYAQGNYADSYFDANPFHFGWQRGDSFNFSDRLRSSKDFSLTSGHESFELSDAARTDDYLGAPTGVNQPSKALNRLEILIKFCAQGDPDAVLDTFTIKDDDFTDGTGEARSRPSDKGIFRITFEKNPAPPTEFTWNGAKIKIPNDFNYRQTEFDYRYKIRVQMEAKIPYSRLTNRFAPWIGFVNKRRPWENDFSSWIYDHKKLAFPGGDFFTKTDFDFKDPYQVDYQHIEALKSKGPDGYKELMSLLDEYNKASLPSLGGNCSTYLSDGYLEFIPITAPEGGRFEFNSSDVDVKDIEVIKYRTNYIKNSFGFMMSVQEAYTEKTGGIKYVAKRHDMPVAFTAKTDLVYPGTGEITSVGGRISPFDDFSWPWNESQYSDFLAQQRDKRKTLDKELGGDPQNYTGQTKNGTFWELDENEIAQRKLNQNNSRTGFGQVRFDKSVGKSTWITTESFGLFLPVPNDVDEAKYTAVSNTSGINVSPSSGGKDDILYAEDAETQGVDWTTANDTNLLSSDGLIRSRQLIFNSADFKGKRILYISSGREEEGLKRNESFAYQLNNTDHTSGSALKYTFLTYDPFGRDNVNTPIDNPNVVITDWQVTVKDKTGNTNRDIALEKVTLNGKRLDDTFTLKLKLDASEARYVEILGSASGPYELMYFDGKTWKTIYQSSEGKTGRLAWWNVSRLNGKYTVLLRTLSGNFIATQDVQIGTLVGKGGGNTYSTYKRAQLMFPSGAFVNGSKLPQDQIVTITPVAINEIYIRNRPIIITSGPIVEIKPSPWKFTVSSIEGVDQRPTLKFVYTFDDLAELDVDTSKVTGIKGDVAPELMLPWNIHQVTAAGDLQIISDNHQTVEDYGDEKHYVFYAALDHFSTYALLPGKFSLSAPIVFADRYITNKNTATIYGTAEPGSVLTLYLKSENVPPEVEKSESYFARISAEAATGNYKFENVGPLREGDNYIFVTSHLGDEKGIRTYSDVTIVKDTVPPSAEAKPNLYAFSPNGDGKYDSVDFILKSNERGKICLQLTTDGSPFFNQEISAEAEKDVKLTWVKEGFALYRRDPSSGNWSLVSNFPLSEKLSDGAYNWTVYAIDEAGNISNNLISQTVVDTTPPKILEFLANPNPFTPNDDGIKDTTKFWYKFSEPAYVSQGIFRDDGKLFRSHEAPTENFVYPTLLTAYSIVPSAGGWEWDGRGSRNELLGGTYTWSILAEDWVGNSTSSEVKQIVVDREPTLIPYAYAEPDPFAPVNPSNSFTEIKYYLSRDNLKVGVSAIGNEGKTIKTLVAGEIQGKGEHSVRWYGDFNADYEGPTASKNKYRVGDSSYEFKIRAEDPGEAGAKPAEVSNTVLVDNVSPNILIKDLAVDYVKKQANILYSIPENSSVEVSVLDSESRVLSVLVTDEAQAAGEHAVNYPLAGREGQNYFKIVAIDRARNMAEKKSSAFAVNPDQFRLATHNASPSTFTPNGDGLIDITRISYQVAGGVPEYRVWIDIRTQSGSTVKRLVVNDPQDRGTYSFYWDGKNDAGQMAPDGYYEYLISAEDKLGVRVEGQGPLVMISARPAVDISTSIPIFSPNGDGASDRVMFNYSINYATFFISGEALVRIDVLNSTGEAVWSKTFNHTAGSYAYEYDGMDSGGAPLPAGDYYVKIFGQDALWSTAVPKTIGLKVDYTQPEPSDFSIDPAYAKLGANVSIKLSFAEPLADMPAVRLTLSDGTTRSLSVAPSETASYECSYVISNDDPEGTVTVSIEARDLALNPINRIKAFVIDKTSPEVSGLSVSPNPASTPGVSGSVSIKFDVSEPLGEAPRVYVTQNGAPSSLTYGSVLTANSYEYKYDAFAGYDGPALITIEVVDLANNLTTQPANNLLMVDTTKPVISNIRTEIDSNPEYTKFAKEGSEVTIRFNVSENLKFNPEVKINGNAANYDSLNLGEYAYKYTVNGADTEGNAAITIFGLDYALNEGTAETSSSSESFVIDLINPTVVIASPTSTSEYISNPGDFSTNTNPDGSDRPRSTTFSYGLPELSKVSVKVHKVSDSQATYTKADFNSGNLIKTLVADVWQSGSQTVAWNGSITNNLSSYDANNDDWADPGKYAFIVEGRDRAGNLTLKKWGGTVWVQDNVLTLKEPDQRDFVEAHIIPTPEVNPDPHYISPNGNSEPGPQKWARFFFMIDLSLNPASGVPWLPERIEAMAVAAHTKAIGNYSVKVYSDSGLTDLVRTIVSAATAEAATLTWEDWNGKNDAGQFVDNGTYYMAVDVRDFAGNPANDNLLKRSVVIDNTAPTVSNLSVNNYYFCAGKDTDTDPARRASTISYEVGDNGSRVNTTIDILRAGVKKATLMNTTSQDANANYVRLWSGEGYDIDGTYKYQITTVDLAGNMASAEGQAVMDKTAPTGTLTINNSTDIYTTSPSVTLNLTYSDTTSGMDKMSFSNDNSVWTSWENPSLTKAWTLPGADGGKSVYVKYVDRAGNYLNANDSIVLDTVNPYFASGPTVNPAHTPVGSWSTHVDPYISFTASDATSGVRDLHGYIDGADQGAMPYYTTSWHPNVSDGTHNLKLRINDNAGRYIDSSTYTFLIDTTPPNVPSVSVAHTPVGSWSNHNSPYFTWSDPGDGNGSGVSYYQGFIDGANQGTVSSGWHPTLGEGTHTVYIRTVDGVGLYRDSSTFMFYVDTQAPNISQPSDRTFNPYVDGPVRVDFTASDPIPSSGFSVSYISARIKYGTNTVKTLSIYDDGSNNYHIVWDGLNNYGDYENEGDYSLEISASDAIGNPAETKASMVSLIDDQYIGQGYNPSLSISEGRLTLNWLFGWDDSQRVMTEAYVSDADHGNYDAYPDDPPDDAYYADKEYFTLEFPQVLETSNAAFDEWAPSEYHAIKKASDDTVMWSHGHTGYDETGSTHYFTPLISAGAYYAYVIINDEGASNTYAFTKVWYNNRRYNQYTRSSSDLGRNWGGTAGPVLIDSDSTGPSVYPNYEPVVHYDPTFRPYPIGAICHGARVGDGLYYKRGSITDYTVTSYFFPGYYIITPVISWSNEVKISRVGDQPSITADTSGNAYVAWLVRVGLNQQIDFQKIPVNFARITGTVQGAAIKVDSKPLVTTQSATPELPTLLSPADGAALDTRRPTFEWKAPKTAYKDYKVLWAKGGRFDSLDLNDKGESPLRQENIHGTSKSDDSTHIYFGYTIPHIDPALEQFTPSSPTDYSWKVTAVTSLGGTAVTSEVRTFRCEPDLEMTGITNWPNPFNPNREETNIRYKLSRDADEVKIRIYDITGALVVDLDGDTGGEGTSMLTKYHDVKWNGRNGRGDMVMNGIYPFEVTARLGDKSVSGRGKIAVLK